MIEKEAEDEGYSAWSPSLPGCFSNGRTIDEARHSMRQAIQQHVAALLAHGDPVPQKERLVHVEEVSIGSSDGAGAHGSGRGAGLAVRIS